MQDFLQDCMEDFRGKAKLTTPISPSDFRELFCSKCKNSNCSNRQSGDPLSHRVATQFERLVNAAKADPFIPQYADIIAEDWVDMTKEALKLAASDRRGDWEVPDIDMDITDGVPQLADRDSTDDLDDAVRRLAEAQGKDAPEMPAAPEEAEEADEPEPVTPVEPAPQHPKADPKFRPAGRGNADDQSGMIDGGPAPKPEKPVDPWAVTPKKGGPVVMSGATIRFDAGGEIDNE